MANKKFWQSYEEYNSDPEYLDHRNNEFKEKLPFASFELKNQKSTPRRDFLKMLGFSVSAAAIAASCEQPIRKAIPYVIQPEEIVPGIANYYASSFINGNDYGSILVKTREGRPIKIEANPNSGINGTDARTQTSVIGLYDNTRLKGPKYKGESITWDEVDRNLGDDLKAIANNGEKVVILSANIISPSTQKLINEFGAQFANFEHVVFEPVSYAGMLVANKKCFGKEVIPSYNFDKANIVVSFQADFLNTWLNPNDFLSQYGKARKISRKNPKMMKHVQFEALMTNTGSNADERYIVKQAYLPMAIAALYNAVANRAGGTALSGNFNKGINTDAINKTAKQLVDAKGKSIVVAGSNDPNVQALVNGINNMLGNYGNTIDLSKPYNIGNSSDEAFHNLVNKMEAGQVGAIFLHNVNPIYAYCESNRFAAALKKVIVSASFNQKNDETSPNVQYLLPNNHYLESWNDAEPKKGSYSLAQPCISPLFKTRQFQDTLLKWMGSDQTFYDYLKTSWQGISGNWEQSLHDGFYEQKIAAEEIDYSQTQSGNIAGAVGAAVSSIVKKTSAIGDKIEVVLHENLLGNGKYADNPYLQEVPDPVTKVVWGNCLSMSKVTAKNLGFKEGELVRISANKHQAEMPVIFQPGQAENTLGIAMGYGRTEMGVADYEVGANVFPFLSYNNNNKTFDYDLVVNKNNIKKVGGVQAVARTQAHHNINDYLKGEDEPSQYDRKEQLIREATLDDYKKNKWAGNEISEKKFRDPHYWDSHMNNLYDDVPELKEGHHWGMSVDMSACTGCSACVAACNIENNVPVVGKEEVFRAHEMHWLRIDRYYIGKDDNPSVAFQPMMCQHCDNAPCENVCPVSATNHSSEGLNQMAYNRCIGTRYCANNCPFKVRRFNWFDYSGADSFLANTALSNDKVPSLLLGKEPTEFMADDLSRMVLNPDVTVRSRGVMEKCSFCVQRIQSGKLTAKKEGRVLADKDITTACQQACSAGAITFGDMNDKNSEAFKLAKLDERAYGLLEEIHVLPSVRYLTKIRNTDALNQDAVS